jgi:hypothetical protein
MLPLPLLPTRSAERKRRKLPGKRRRRRKQQPLLVLVLVAAVGMVVAVGFDRRRAGIWMHRSILPSVHYAQRARSLLQFVVTSWHVLLALKRAPIHSNLV